MRRLACLAILSFGLVAACGGDPKEGAILTFASPDGPMQASRIEVVLANAASDTISDVAAQRVQPGSTDDNAVRYYRQRALGGTVEGMSGLTGFQLRIEANIATSPDEQFIPFVLVYDGDTLAGVGVVEDDNGDPGPVQITAGMLNHYTVAVTPVTVAGDESPVDRGTSRTVTCTGLDGGAWTSGIAWWPVADPTRPNGRAHQLRLLLPDLGVDPMATDATPRSLDLDCDTQAAGNGDCDDLRAAYHSGAADSCDGLDTNCDGQRYVPQGCIQSGVACNFGTTTNSGVQICDDEKGTLGACTPTAACACAANPQSCAHCVVDVIGTTAAKTFCAPAVGKVALTGCGSTSCTVEVVNVTNGWRALVGTSETGSFGDKISGVHSFVELEVKKSGAFPFQTGSSGEVYLQVTDATNRVTIMPVDLQMSGDNLVCTPVTNAPTLSRMICSP